MTELNHREAPTRAFVLGSQVTFTACCLLIVSSTSRPSDAACLELQATVPQDRVVERLPLIIQVTLTNTCDEPEPAWYYADTAELMERWSALIVRNDSGEVLRLKYMGGPQRRVNLPRPEALEKDSSVRREFVRSLIFRDSRTPRERGAEEVSPRYLAPGSYVGRLEIPHTNGRQLVSNDFAFDVADVPEDYRDARDRIGISHAGFFEGRDVPMDQSVYRGGRSPEGVDRTRYREIQDLLEKYPSSPYAEWIRFWRTYRYGSGEEALTYARAHSGFPLSDNLMLRAAQKLYNEGEYSRARAVLTELDQRFPDGDARHLGQQLRKYLAAEP